VLERDILTHLRSTVQLLYCSKRDFKMPFMFENLDVYQKSVDLAETIITLTGEFPKGYYFLTDQLNRASLSIATNIAEGNGRFTKGDRRNFFIIARGSVQECIPLLEIAKRKQLISDVKLSDLSNQLEVISKMISGLINGLERRKL
jgi:four helix bundle protein